MENGGLADTLILRVGLVLDDGTRHALAYQCDVITSDTCQYGFTEVVKAVGYEDEELFGGLVGIHLVGLCHSVQQTLGIPLFNLYHLLGITNG